MALGPKPLKDTDWEVTTPALIVEPPVGKRAAGWTPSEKPPCEYVNFLQLYQWRWSEFLYKNGLGMSSGGPFETGLGILRAEEGSAAGLFTIKAGGYVIKEYSGPTAQTGSMLIEVPSDLVDEVGPGTPNTTADTIRLDCVILTWDSTARAYDFDLLEGVAPDPTAGEWPLLWIVVGYHATDYNPIRYSLPYAPIQSVRQRVSVVDGAAYGTTLRIGGDASQEDIQAVIDQLSMIGGGTVEISGERVRILHEITDALLPPVIYIKSGVTVDLCGHQITCDAVNNTGGAILVGPFLFAAVGQALTGCSLVAASSALTLSGATVEDFGYGSILRFDSGANSGTLCRLTGTGTAGILLDLDYRAIVLAADVGAVSCTVFIDRAGIRDGIIDCANTLIVQAMRGLLFSYTYNFKAVDIRLINGDAVALGYDTENYDAQIWRVSDDGSFTDSVAWLGGGSEVAAENTWGLADCRFGATLPAEHPSGSAKILCRYKYGDTGPDIQTILTTADDDLIFNVRDYDSPGASRLNIATGIFTADRQMTVRVNVQIRLLAYTPAPSEWVQVRLQKYTGVWADYGAEDVMVEGFKEQPLKFSATVPLSVGDAVKVKLYNSTVSSIQVGGIDVGLNLQGFKSYIEIVEV